MPPPAPHNAMEKLFQDDKDGALVDNNIQIAAGISITEAKYPAASSSVACLNKQLRELEVRYHRTRGNLEKAMLKNEHVQKELRKLRGENQLLEKELHKKKGLLERVAADKKQVEAQAIANRDYAKRIEQKIAMGAKGHAAASRNAELLARIRELEAQDVKQRSAFAAKEDELQDAVERIAILKRSLEIRLRDMMLEGSLHNGMIFEIARLQQLNEGLSMQIAAEVDRVHALQSMVKKRDKELAEMDRMRIEAERRVAERETDLANANEQLLLARKQTDELADEKKMLMTYVQDQAEMRLKAEASIKQLQTTHKRELDALQLQLQAKDASERDVRHELASHQQAYDKILQAYNITQDALSHERSGTESLRALIQEKTFAMEKLEQELRNAQDDAQLWQHQAEDFGCKLSLIETEAVGFKETIRTLQSQLSVQEGLASQYADDIQKLKGQIAQSAADFDALTNERNEAARAMNEAVTISAMALDDQQTLKQQIQMQQGQIEQLKQSKTLLQNAMLEQLAGVRKQLQLERIGRLTAEGKVQQSRESSASMPLSPSQPPPPPTDEPTVQAELSLLDLASSR
ncbi:unnamed protein product [Aphanomyces euteiches]